MKTGAAPTRAGLGGPLSSQELLGSTPMPGISLLLAPPVLPGGDGLAPPLVFMALLWSLPFLAGSGTELFPAGLCRGAWSGESGRFRGAERTGKCQCRSRELKEPWKIPQAGLRGSAWGWRHSQLSRGWRNLVMR